MRPIMWLLQGASLFCTRFAVLKFWNQIFSEHSTKPSSSVGFDTYIYRQFDILKAGEVDMKISDSFKLWKIVRKVFGLIGATFAVWIELRLIYKHKYWKDNIKKTYAENSVPGSLASGGESMLSSSLSIFIFIAMINNSLFLQKKNNRIRELDHTLEITKSWDYLHYLHIFNLK